MNEDKELQESVEEKKQKKRKPDGFLKDLFFDVLIALFLAAIILFFISPTIVKQSSMENTLKENDYIIMYKQAYRSKLPERGDIIIFQSELPDPETGKDKLLIKRVIGLPGDEISIIDNRLYINDFYYKEDYLKDGYTPASNNPAPGESVIVPDNQFFVMGDNRAGSVDSRFDEVGCVHLDLIRGKAVLRLFPLKKIARL